MSSKTYIKHDKRLNDIPFNIANIPDELNVFDLALSKRLMFVLGINNVVDSIYFRTIDNTLIALPVATGNCTKLTNDAIPLLSDLIAQIKELRKTRIEKCKEDIENLRQEKKGNIQVVHKFFSKLELCGAVAVSDIADVYVTKFNFTDHSKKDPIPRTIEEVGAIVPGTETFVPTDSTGKEIDLATSVINNITLLRTKDNAVRSDKIIPYSNDKNEAAMRHLDLNSIIDSSKPSTELNEYLLQRLPNDAQIECFKAFIWSAYKADNTSRQVVYIFDPEGYSGKSVLFDSIFEPLHKIDAVKTVGKTFTGDFGMENCYDARVLIIPDNKNPQILRSQLMHQLTGKDEITINAKFVRQFQFKPRLSIWAHSNILPIIDVAAAHERTRIALFQFKVSDKVKKQIFQTDKDGNVILDTLGFPITKGDNSFVKKLRADVPYFLAECKTAYEKLCSTNADIDTSSISENLVQLIDGDETMIEINNFCSKYIQVDHTAPYCKCITTEKLEKLYKEAKECRDITCATFNDLKEHITKISKNHEWSHPSHGKRYIPGIVEVPFELRHNSVETPDQTAFSNKLIT